MESQVPESGPFDKLRAGSGAPGICGIPDPRKERVRYGAPGFCVPLELAPSLVPGESMSAGRTKAILATVPVVNAQLSAQGYGASRLLVYGGGSKRTIAVANASFVR